MNAEELDPDNVEHDESERKYTIVYLVCLTETH